MKRTAIVLGSAAVWMTAGLLTSTLRAAGAKANSGPVEFTTHVIAQGFRGGYMVAVADVNHDGKPDLIPMGLPEVAWYENPTWEKHVMANDLRGLLWAAPYDMDGDGIPEFAILSDFGQDPKTSKGTLTILKSQGDPKAPWKEYKVDAVPTAHRVVWADLDGDGHKEIVLAPFIGLKGWEQPHFQDYVPVYYWEVPKDLEGPWKREVLDDKLYGVVHHMHALKWTPGKRDEILTAGFDGIVLHSATGRGAHMKFTHKVLTKGDEARETPAAGMTKGANDVRILNIKGKRFLAAQEPWHGDEMVVYTNKNGQWERNVIFKGFVQGHEMAVADLNGDGRDDIVAVDEGRRGQAQPLSVHVFYSEDDAGTQWRHQVVDQDHMAGSGVIVQDMNGDGRPDIVAISNDSLKYYENMGPAK